MDLANWFSEVCNSGSLVKYLEAFDHTVAVMQTREGLERVAYESVMDLAEDGVIYGELRWAPEQHLAGGLSLDETVEAVQDGLERAMEEISDQAASSAPASWSPQCAMPTGALRLPS